MNISSRCEGGISCECVGDVIVGAVHVVVLLSSEKQC